MIKNVTDNHEIPNNWIWVDLEQLCNITSGNPAPQNKNFFKNGNVPFVRVQDMGRMGNNVYLRETKDYLNNDAVAKNNMKLFPKGSVLFTKSGMSILLNQRAILGLDMHVVSHIGICLPTKFTLSEWIYYWLKSIDFKELTHATTLPSLKLSKVQKIRIPLPPLSEQHRIVAKIEELLTKLDAGVEALKQVQAQLKRYRQSVLKAAVEGKLTAEWREQHKDELEPANILLKCIQKERKAKLGKKYKEPMPIDTSDLPELPEEWSVSSVGSLYDIVGGGTPSTKVSEYWDGDNPWITSADISDQGKISPRKSITQEGIENSATNLVPKNSLIVVTRVGLGKVALTDFPLCFSQDSQALVRSENYINPKFAFYYLLRTVQIFKYRSRGTTISGVTKKQLFELPFYIPPYQEQQEIINRIESIYSAIDACELIITSELRRAKSLRQSILKRAFEGKFMPQDPDDEPASVLLERIKAEKAKPKKYKQMEMF